MENNGIDHAALDEGSSAPEVKASPAKTPGKVKLCANDFLYIWLETISGKEFVGSSAAAFLLVLSWEMTGKKIASHHTYIH